MSRTDVERSLISLRTEILATLFQAASRIEKLVSYWLDNNGGVQNCIDL